MVKIFSSLLLGCLVYSHALSSSLITFRGETLLYDLYYHGIPIAKACLQIPLNDSLVIRATIDTKPLTDLIFKVHNTYKVYLRPDSEHPIRYSKHIHQSNISQNLSIRYDMNQLKAFMNDANWWDITSNTTNLFIMLYQLRCFTLTVGDSIVFNLDVESEAWRAIGRIQQNKRLQIANHGSEFEIDFKFLPGDNLRRRQWKTDLLTNRITKGGHLLIILGGKPWKIPLLMKFGSGDNSIETKFIKRIQGN